MVSRKKKSCLSDNKHGENGYGKLVSCLISSFDSIWFLDSVHKSCLSNNKHGKYEHGKFVSSLISIFIVFGLSKTLIQSLVPKNQSRGYFTILVRGC